MMRMDGMGAGPRPLLPHEKAVIPYPPVTYYRADMPQQAAADMMDIRQEMEPPVDALEALKSRMDDTAE